MKLRFFKKKDGSKVLQQQTSENSYEWEDVPMEEETKTVTDKIYSHILEARKDCRNREKTFTILVSSKIMNEIVESRRRYSPLSELYPNSFMHHKLYEVPKMKTDIKILVEV